MPNITPEITALENAITAFEEATRGKDVRDAIVSQGNATMNLANKLNDDLDTAISQSFAVPDTTLTQVGKPGEAKATGDALALKADAADVTALATTVAGKADAATMTTELAKKVNKTSAQMTNAQVTGEMQVQTYMSVGNPTRLYTHNQSFDVGDYCEAAGENSMAQGESCLARSKNQFVHGKYNIEDTSNVYAEIIGNGSNNTPANIHTVDWSGNAWYKGVVKVGGTSYADASELATKAYVDAAIGTAIGGSY